MPQGNVTAHGSAGGEQSAMPPTAHGPAGGPVLLKKSRAIAHTRPCSLVVFVVFVLYVLGIAPTLCTAQSAMRSFIKKQKIFKKCLTNDLTGDIFGRQEEEKIVTRRGKLP